MGTHRRRLARVELPNLSWQSTSPLRHSPVVIENHHEMPARGTLKWDLHGTWRHFPLYITLPRQDEHLAMRVEDRPVLLQRLESKKAGRVSACAGDNGGAELVEHGTVLGRDCDGTCHLPFGRLHIAANSLNLDGVGQSVLARLMPILHCLLGQTTGKIGPDEVGPSSRINDHRKATGRKLCRRMEDGRGLNLPGHHPNRKSGFRAGVVGVRVP